VKNLTKCKAYWKIIRDFKTGNKIVTTEEGEELTGFEGFQVWCGKSYTAARLDWTTYEVLEAIAKRLNISPCEVPSTCNITENMLRPLVHLRKRKGPEPGEISELQITIIEALIPKMLSGKITKEDIKREIEKYKPAKYKRKSYKLIKSSESFQSTNTKFSKELLLNNLLKIIHLIDECLPAPEPLNTYLVEIKNKCHMLFKELKL